METSGSFSQSQDNSRGHRETEDLDGAAQEEPDILKDELQLYGDAPGEVVPSGEAGLRRRGSDPASVYRIHSVLHGFIPLFQKFRLMGFRKTD
ncbi:transmembrane protein 40 isoform d [Daubentonia madagascariensis]|uniref:Transmembrane protein 40 isoform d n=1 Tax=Daubentonia madagascariensis TaxID=31869 RepID=A0ABD2FE93_DAUMA